MLAEGRSHQRWGLLAAQGWDCGANRCGCSWWSRGEREHSQLIHAKKKEKGKRNIGGVRITQVHQWHLIDELKQHSAASLVAAQHTDTLILLYPKIIITHVELHQCPVVTKTIIPRVRRPLNSSVFTTTREAQDAAAALAILHPPPTPSRGWASSIGLLARAHRFPLLLGVQNTSQLRLLL